MKINFWDSIYHKKFYESTNAIDSVFLDFFQTAKKDRVPNSGII